MLQKSRTEDLWIAIVGSTEFYLNEMMTKKSYASLYDVFTQLISVSDNTDFIRKCQKDHRQLKVVSYGKISAVDDLRLPLLRHWSLRDAALNSPYVAARLQTWTDPGIRTLESWLAKAGL